MKRTLTLIAITAASFGMSAASCDPVPTVVENIATFDEDPATCPVPGCDHLGDAVTPTVEGEALCYAGPGTEEIPGVTNECPQEPGDPNRPEACDVLPEGAPGCPRPGEG